MYYWCRDKHYSEQLYDGSVGIYCCNLGSGMIATKQQRAYMQGFYNAHHHKGYHPSRYDDSLLKIQYSKGYKDGSR